MSPVVGAIESDLRTYQNKNLRIRQDFVNLIKWNNYVTIRGIPDHIHILCTLPKTMAPADLVEEIKKSSSKWIKTKGDHYKNFYWQDGYGGFSVSNSGVEKVKGYILNQKKHHEKVSFIDEYKTLLEAYGIPFEDRYL
jgi:putative transposase